MSAQKERPHCCPLNTKAEHNSVLKAETDHLSFDVLIPAQWVPTQIERTACQMTEEENVQSWESSLDEDCSKKDSGANVVSVSPAQEFNGASFILVVQTTEDKDKYTEAIIIQQVYKGSSEQRPRRKTHRKGMKHRSSLPIKLRCPKLFEVDDQINTVLLIYDEPG